MVVAKGSSRVVKSAARIRALVKKTEPPTRQSHVALFEIDQRQRVASAPRALAVKGNPNVVGTPVIVGTPVWVVAHVGVLGASAQGRKSPIPDGVAGDTGDEISPPRQPQNREVVGYRRSGDCACSRRRGDRVMSPSGTSRRSLRRLNSVATGRRAFRIRQAFASSCWPTGSRTLTS